MLESSLQVMFLFILLRKLSTVKYGLFFSTLQLQMIRGAFQERRSPEVRSLLYSNTVSRPLWRLPRAKQMTFQIILSARHVAVEPLGISKRSHEGIRWIFLAYLIKGGVRITQVFLNLIKRVHYVSPPFLLRLQLYLHLVSVHNFYVIGGAGNVRKFACRTRNHCGSNGYCEKAVNGAKKRWAVRTPPFNY